MASLGIDIGGQFWKVVGTKASGEMVVVLNRDGKESTPTALYFAKGGQVYFGRDAIQQGRIDPTGLVRNFKLDLGSKKAVHGTFTARDLYTMIFGEMKRLAEAQLREQVTHCVVVRPANFHDDQTADLNGAAEDAGMAVDAVVTEPAAAVFDVLYGRKNTLDPNSVLRIAGADLGSTTYDNSVIEYKGGVATVVATKGVRVLGGINLTQVLHTMVEEAVSARVGRPVTLAKLDPTTRYRLESELEEAKLALSSQASTTIVVPVGKGDDIFTLNKAEFDSRSEAVLAPAVECFRQMLKEAKLAIADLDLFILAGGPFLSEAVRSYFEKSLGISASQEAHPVLAVARGAARYGLQLAASQGRADRRSIAEHAPKLREATSEAYGLAVVDVSGGTRRNVCAVILRKGTKLPATTKATFRLERENQTRAELLFLQGSDGASVDRCTEIGKAVMEGLPPETARSTRIEAEFTVGSTGMVEVDVRDSISGKSMKVTLKPPAQSGKPLVNGPNQIPGVPLGKSVPITPKSGGGR